MWDRVARFWGDRADAVLLLVSFIVCVVLGHLVVMAHTVSLGATPPGAPKTAPPQGVTPFLWALACLAAGALSGFLFGVPRTTDRATVPANVLKEAKAAAVDPPGTPVRLGSTETRVNTNLEQVSDWLTKIIVGVGLTQIQRIPKAIENLATTLSHELNHYDPRANLGFSEALVVYFSVVGFLFAYLLTRVYLQKVFRVDDGLP